MKLKAGDPINCRSCVEHVVVVVVDIYHVRVGIRGRGRVRPPLCGNTGQRHNGILLKSFYLRRHIQVAGKPRGRVAWDLWLFPERGHVLNFEAKFSGDDRVTGLVDGYDWTSLAYHVASRVKIAGP